MKDTKKLLALLLALVMCFGLLAGCNNNDQPSGSGSGSSPAPGNTGTPGNTNSPAPNNSNTPAGNDPGQQETYENKIILGDTTALGGDFRAPGWGGSSAGAADQAVWFLTAGYAAMESDKYGSYQWNQVAVLNHSEVDNADGSKTYTVEIAHDLTFSDGTPITAKHYVADVLSFSSGPVCADANRSGMSGQTLVGFAAFNRYAGPNEDYTNEFLVDEEGNPLPKLDEDGNEVKDAQGNTVYQRNPFYGGKKEFAGVRLLDEYTYQLTVNAEDLTYFGYTTAALQPNPLGLFLGEGVDIADDGDGCYLTDNFYEKNADGQYVKGLEILGNRFDVTKYPYSGPYTITEWDEGTQQCTLTLNPLYKGNFEGQKPSIETVVYVKATQETMLGELQTGGIDLLQAVTGGTDTQNALAMVNDGTGKFGETHYQRAGYGKIQFDCDFGPTMFPEVRQAIAYLLNRVEFCQNFTGGYGVVVDGPYSPDFAMWRAVEDDITLTDYSYSPNTAIKLLEDGGWVYNSKGEAYVEGQTGVDAVRYKKLTAEEANAATGDGTADVNKTYASVSNTDGVTYTTVEINGEYYMPLVINWLGTNENTVTDLLTTMLANSSDVTAAGMIIRASRAGDFNILLGNIYRMTALGYGGTPVYGMFNLATGWNSEVYDYAYNWSLDPLYFDYSSNKIYDEYDKAFPYDKTAPKLTYEEAMAASGNKLGMDYLSMAMVYNSTTKEEYYQWWMGYIERWNQLMPDIPLYSNFYYDVYNTKLENLETTPFFGPRKALVYANVKGY